MEPTRTTISCANCGKPVEAMYCSSCGEKILTEQDRSVSSLVSEHLELFLNFDSKLLRTISLLILKPGILTAEYWNGRRIAYVKPLQLLIAINLFYFFASFLSEHLGYYVRVMFPTLSDILTDRIFSSWAKQMVNEKIAVTHQEFSAYAGLFNTHLEDAAKSLVVVLVPILALFLQIFFFRSKRNFLYHLTAATHLVCFYVLFWSSFMIILGVATKVSVIATIGVLRYTSVMILVAYIYFTLKRLYERSVIMTIITSAVFVFGVIQAITNVYDFVLFYLVYCII